MKTLKSLLLFLLVATFASCETKSNYSLKVKFPEGQNLKIGADVKSRDVAIGSVTSIDLFGSEGILVDLEIDPKYKVPKDSKIKMQVENLFIGEKFINIDFSDSAEFWENNDTLVGIAGGLFDFNLEDMGIDGIKGLDEIDLSEVSKLLEEIDLSAFQEQLENINIEDFEGDFQELQKEFQQELDKMSPEELEKLKKQMNEVLEKSNQK